MSYSPPKVFISATAADLRSVRAAITEALSSIGCVPVEVPSFEPDSATISRVLREEIESCQALIHIAGTRYGPEPDPATLPAGAPRRSYTQMEYHIGCEVKQQRGDGEFWMYVFVCPEDFPYDPVPGTEISEKWALQDAHRNRLPKSPFFCGCPDSVEDMHSWALGLQHRFPPPPPPPPPPMEAPVVQVDERLPELAPELPRTSTSADTAVAPSPPGRSRLPIVLVTLAAMGVVAILAAAWILQQRGFFGRSVVGHKAPERSTVPTAKSGSHASPEPAPFTPAPKTVPVLESRGSQPEPPDTRPLPPAPSPVVTKEATRAPAPPPVPSPAPPPASPGTPAPSPTTPPASPATPPSAPSRRPSTAIDLVRRAAVAMNPASKMSAAEIGKLYVEQPVLNGKNFTRADIVRQAEQFRRTWDTQAYEIIEGPKVTSGEGTNHVTVKVKTRFAGVPKTGIKFSTVIVTSEFVVIVSADGTPLIESQRELSQE